MCCVFCTPETGCVAYSAHLKPDVLRVLHTWNRMCCVFCTPETRCVAYSAHLKLDVLRINQMCCVFCTVYLYWMSAAIVANEICFRNVEEFLKNMDKWWWFVEHHVSDHCAYCSVRFVILTFWWVIAANLNANCSRNLTNVTYRLFKAPILEGFTQQRILNNMCTIDSSSVWLLLKGYYTHFKSFDITYIFSHWTTCTICCIFLHSGNSSFWYFYIISRDYFDWFVMSHVLYAYSKVKMKRP